MTSVERSSTQETNTERPRSSKFWRYVTRIAAAVALLGVFIGGAQYAISLVTGFCREFKDLKARVSVLEKRKGTIPSPIQLGFARRDYFTDFVNPRSWKAIHDFNDAQIDWRSIPEDIEVYAEANIWAEQMNSSEGEKFARIHLRETESNQVAASFQRVQATTRGQSISVRRVSNPLLRDTNIRIYRLEILGDSGVRIKGDGRLLFRRRDIK